ncbi:C-type lectin domain family 4 member F-like [Haliotis rufescens]|uniref:C-type lectin domain family 4 member F-like n=1 Tax=Haliotis rufescens TaxID=6454 RepID=UPI00201E8434|nr:C-type lectin domain family 4 member F-like [Haliotis rufescens]
MASAQTFTLGLCILLASLPHGMAFPPNLASTLESAVSGTAPSPSSSPALAIPSSSSSSSSSSSLSPAAAASPISGPGGTIASPFAGQGFTLPSGKSKDSTSTRVQRNEDSIGDMETFLEELQSSLTNITISQNSTAVDVASLFSDLNSLQSQMSSLTSSVTTIQQANAAAPAPGSDYSADIHGLTTSVAGVEGELATVQSTLEASITDVGADVTTLEDSLADLASSVTGVEDLAMGYDTRINALSNSIANVPTHEDLASIESDISGFEARIASVEGQSSNQVVDDLETRVSDLESAQSTDYTSEINALQERANSLEQTVAGVDATVQSLDTSISDQLIEQDLKHEEASASIVDLMTEMADLRADIGVCQRVGGCEDIHTMIETMQNQASEIQVLVDSIQGTATENAVFVSDYTVKFNGMETTIGTLQSHLDAQAISVSGIDSLSTTVDGIAADLADLQTVGSQTDSAVADVQANVADHANSIGTLQTGVTGLQSSLDALVAEIATVSSDSSANQNALETQVGNLQNQLDDLSDVVDSMVEDIDTSCDYPWSYRSGPSTCIYSAYWVKAYWIDAKEWCESFGSNYRLYVVDTYAKKSDLVSYINYQLWDFTNDYLIGFFGFESQNYKWVDGSSNFDYYSWCSGEPNNWGHGCGSLWNGAGLCLDDVNCDAYNKFICEKVIS